jgi:hypothetical protein
MNWASGSKFDLIFFFTLKTLKNVQDKAMIIAMEYAAGGTLLELLDARVKICI